MTTTIEQMRAQVRGEVIEASDDGYDEARKVYNGMHDRRPRAVVRCADASDVIAAVRAAREQGLELAVRGGGHSVPGFGTSDDGIVIDLSPMRNVHVDPAVAVARAGGGAVWGDFDHATHAFGLATTGGVISTTGVSGLTLGGGIGYLARRYGLSCDNLIAADVVTADGELVTASERQHEDLFWALRGGGGNFGIATSLEFELHPVDEIVGGPIFFELDAAAEVLRVYREYIAHAPEELGAFFAFQIAPPLPFIPENRQGDTLCAIVTCWSGAPADADAALKPLLDAGPVVAQHVGPMPYPALNSAFDPLLPPGLQHYWKADFVKELTDDAIAAHVEHGSKVPCVQSTMHLYPINGAVNRVGADETAFAYRDVNFACVIAGMWPEPADNAANTQWVRDYWSAIHPYSGTEGGYVNFMAADDHNRVAANYGPNYERLSRIKATYDRDNVFHLNQNIEPATT
jgi:FAD/FMN-containing dehydrogenase